MLGTSESSGGAKRAKEKEDGGSSSKGKGKGKGKKSFETKPVRKEQIQTRCVTVVDSNKNSMDSDVLGIEDDITSQTMKSSS